MKDKEYLERADKIKPRLYRIAFSYFYSESMAVDAVDEAVYKGWLKKNSIRDEAFTETYLTRILINVCKTTYARYRRETGLEEIGEDIPDESAEAMLENLSLKEAVRRLPEDYRRIVILKFFAGHTLAEIANILDEAPGTVATRLRRALKLLRLDLTEDKTEAIV